MSIRRDFPDIPPVWAAGTLGAQWLADRTLPIIRFEGPWADTIGALIVAAGIGLAAWAALWFWRRRTTIEPRDAPTTLIVEGPFRVNRNPIYAGMALVLIGLGLVMGSLAAMLPPLAFVWIVTRRFVLGEEAALRAAFSDEAEAYIARTRRW